MYSDKESPTPVGPPIPGIEWVNIITGHDHTTGNVDGTYFCEIHLQINLESKEVFNRLNDILSIAAEPGADLDSKLDRVRAILKQELLRANRANISTLAIVNAIKLR